MQDNLISPSSLIQMYSAYPGALEEEVAAVFAALATPEQMMRHNVALSKMGRLFGPGEINRLLWKNVAQAILHTAIHQTGP